MGAQKEERERGKGKLIKRDASCGPKIIVYCELRYEVN